MVVHTNQCMVKFENEEDEESPISPEGLPCEICKEKFQDFTHLMAHKKTCRGALECSSDSSSDDDVFNDNLRNEIYSLIHHSINERNNKLLLNDRNVKLPIDRGKVSSQGGGEGKWVCNGCDSGFSRHDALARHKRHNCSATKKLTCLICSKTFQHSSNLSRHRKMHQNRTTNTGGKRHFSTTNRILPTKRLSCKNIKSIKSTNSFSLGTTSTKSLSITSITATKSRITAIPTTTTKKHFTGVKGKFQCPYCGRCHVSGQELTYHVYTHTGEKPYKCEECGKCFIRKHHLVDHVNGVHLKIRPFSCDICGHGFNRKTLLRIHVEKTHTSGNGGNTFVSQVEKTHKGNGGKKLINGGKSANSSVVTKPLVTEDGGSEDRKVRIKRRSPQV